MTKLDEKGLEAATAAIDDAYIGGTSDQTLIDMAHSVHADMAEKAVRAYLTHTTPTDAEVAEMVKRLREVGDWKLNAAGSSGYMRECCNDAAALIERLSGRVPEGWKMVPVEPTFEMSAAAYDAVDANGEIEAIIGPLETITIYRAMLSASPPFLKEEQKP